MAQTAPRLVEHVIPRVPVHQWVLLLPIPLRLLLAARPKLVTPVLQVVHRAITRFLLDHPVFGLAAGMHDTRIGLHHDVGYATVGRVSGGQRAALIVSHSLGWCTKVCRRR